MTRLNQRLPLALLLLRLSVFLVMLMWTLDKFLNPEHAAAVYQNFYFIGGLGNLFFYIIGTIQLIIIFGFLIGLKKRFTYGAVLFFHTVSTVSAFKQYLNPYQDGNLLFFAAWPMLAACFTLYYLRDWDKKWTLSRRTHTKKIG